MCKSRDPSLSQCVKILCVSYVVLLAVSTKICLYYIQLSESYDFIYPNPSGFTPFWGQDHDGFAFAFFRHFILFIFDKVEAILWTKLHLLWLCPYHINQSAWPQTIPAYLLTWYLLKSSDCEPQSLLWPQKLHPTSSLQQENCHQYSLWLRKQVIMHVSVLKPYKSW